MDLDAPTRSPSRSDFTRAPHLRSRGVTAVLGPTNTGKTHLAIERMIAHESGIIGLPLRLLAREVYGRIAARVGEDQVALVTGEEKIKPKNPRFWVCTVEAMPRDVEPAFLAIDEVQLAANLERGHVFTDRMLHARGTQETLLLGSDTARPLIERLLPGVAVVTRPRMSILAHTGHKKVTRLPQRSAIVAFSASEVYAIAELIRRQRGGAAVVMGALSPRTRNAQVALYQEGEVDYLVATDAIGMGLNLDVDHVVFASARKFDGFQFRQLNPAEMGQIAGRAGRYKNDGTFGTTGRVDPLDDEMVEKIETHTFDAHKVFQWRNPDLDFGSIERLSASLDVIPKERGLTRAPPGPDVQVLEIARKRPEIMDLAASRDDVHRLWEACLVPDYRKVSPNSHADLVFNLFRFLTTEGRVPVDWFAKQIGHCERFDGDIDTLSHRIAHMRTWTFVANRPDWLDDPAHWQDTTRAIEDKLSDALHERLTQRFVDRRTSVLMRRLRENAMLEAEITDAGEVLVEGQPVGRLEGFVFAPERTEDANQDKTLRSAAQAALGQAVNARADRLADAGDGSFILASDAVLRWNGQPVAKLDPTEDVLKPRVRLIADEHLTGPHRDKVQARLDTWLDHHIVNLLRPLFELRTAEGLEGISRGIAYQVSEALGILPRATVMNDVKQIEQTERAKLRALGLRFGAHHLYVPILLKPAPRALTILLWALKNDALEAHGLEDLPRIALSGRTSFARDKETPDGAYMASGYYPAGDLCVRVDILERLADHIRPALSWREGSGENRPAGAMGGAFRVTQDMTSLLGASAEAFASILKSLGYRPETKSIPASVLAVLDAKPEPVAKVAKPEKPAEPSPEAEPAKTEEPAESTVVVVSSEGAGGVAVAASMMEEPAEAVATEPKSDAELQTPEASAEDAPADEQAAAPSESAPEASDPEAMAESEVQPRTGAENAAESTEEAPTTGAPAPENSEMVEVQLWRPTRRQGGGRPERRGREGGDDRPGRRGPPRTEFARSRKPRFERGGDRPDRNRGPRPPAKTQASPPPRRGPDPDSPFAALLALKGTLAKPDTPEPKGGKPRRSKKGKRDRGGDAAPEAKAPDTKPAPDTPAPDDS
ncbi:MAG: helicase-related protein [Pseudomonadota bacterium]